MTTPRIRLAFGALFWRVFLIAAVATEWRYWRRIRRFRPRGHRAGLLLYVTPLSLVRGFVVAGVVTVLVDLYVRFFMRPVLARWYHPRAGGSADSPILFQFEPGEAIEAETPARRGRRPGTLVLTNRRLWFAPAAWAAEPWSIPLASLAAIRTEPAKQLLGSLVRGLPDRLVAVGAEGSEVSFTVADPEAVRDWFAGTALAPTRPDPFAIAD